MESFLARVTAFKCWKDFCKRYHLEHCLLCQPGIGWMLIFGQVLIPYFESRLVSVWVGNWSFRSFCYKKNWIGLSGLSARRRIGSRSSHRRCSIKKRFLKIQQYSQGRLCWCFILIKLQVLQHSCFPVKNF